TATLSTLSLHDALPILFEYRRAAGPYRVRYPQRFAGDLAGGGRLRDRLPTLRCRYRDARRRRSAGASRKGREAGRNGARAAGIRSEEHTSELQSRSDLV